MKSKFVCSILLCLFLNELLNAAAATTQTLELDEGWNAVWLEVDPVYSSGDSEGQNMTVEEVFSDPAIIVVATPLRSITGAEFVTDMSESVSNVDSWQVWYQSSELEFNSLVTVSGYRGYLIKTSADISFSVTGEVRYYEPTWSPFGYTLQGFGLHSADVTFADFFQDSLDAHPINRIFQLDPATGSWDAVNATTEMVSNRAYWIYTDGNSDFTGPVKVDFLGAYEIDFGDGAADMEIPDPESNIGETLDVVSRELVLTNISDREQSVVFSKVSPTLGASSTDTLQIFDVVPTPGTLSYEAGLGRWSETTYPVSSLTTEIATLGAYRNWSSGDAEQENLYQVKFEHEYRWLPISAENPNLSDAVSIAADPDAVGLWIGEVALNQVTSLGEDGRPLTATTSVAPLRLLLHVDTSGNVNLLSHVFQMQEKTADETVPAGEVLVLDEAQIPYYEGIEERAGYRVGQRIEAVGYDMPRELTTVAQTELLDEVASFAGLASESLVTDSDIEAYVGQLASRAPDLAESYFLKWGLSGGLGKNSIVETGANPLTMDAFHRSNPFRHAFHPSHGTGRSLSRSLTLSFNDEGSQSELWGTYTEEISGLGAVPLAASGPIVLRRVSTVGDLVE